jgi:hypothetical protein
MGGVGFGWRVTPTRRAAYFISSGFLSRAAWSSRLARPGRAHLESSAHKTRLREMRALTSLTTSLFCSVGDAGLRSIWCSTGHLWLGLSSSSP